MARGKHVDEGSARDPVGRDATAHEQASRGGTPGRWSAARAWAWHRAGPRLLGCNFIPSTAVNQLEMWQAETFDEETIARELGWAADVGFNTVRVYLHDLAWRQDARGLLGRVDRFLEIAHLHRIATLLVLFDSVWDPDPHPGRQPEPRPRVHNSRWVQGPGREILSDPTRHGELRGYVEGVVGHLRDDPRVLAWDIVNEPDNPNPAYGGREAASKPACALTLLRSAYAWARAVGPRQPLTSGVWHGRWRDPAALSEVDRFLLLESDVVSFHCYLGPDDLRARIGELEQYGRPLLCTEFLARPLGSTFASALPVFADEDVGAYCWGLVAGRTQTIYPWDSWARRYDVEPDPWFHDVLRPDGTPYDAAEARCLRAFARGRGPDRG
jgi:hypothetical protein